MTLMDRRAFIARGIAATGGGALSAVALERLASARGARRQGPPRPQLLRRAAADTRPAWDRGARAARGFSYVTSATSGSRMSDGHLTPLALDGMAAFPGPTAPCG